MESVMSSKALLLLSALCLAGIPGAAGAQSLDGTQQHSITPPAEKAGGDGYGDRNRGGPYGFYSYPIHRHIDGSSSALDRPFSPTSAGTSPSNDAAHGSAYYGPNYGAPYFGGGYYDDGVYYRERREH
jgi:hypothetical protein